MCVQRHHSLNYYRKKKEQRGSNTFPLNVIDQTLNVPYIESGQKYVLMECNGRIEKVKLGVTGS